MDARVNDAPIDVAELIADCEDDGSGAIAIFAGTVRESSQTHPSARVDAITYTAYVPLAEKVLRELERESVQRFGARRCLIRHRVGYLRVGEVSVAIVVRAAHRKDAFAAARHAIDELKQRAPIWKKEHLAGDAGTCTALQGGQPSRT